MSTSNKNKFLRFYPALWDFDMAVKACEKGKLTPEEFEEITGEKFTGEPFIPASEYKALQNELTDTQMALCDMYEAMLEMSANKEA